MIASSFSTLFHAPPDTTSVRVPHLHTSSFHRALRRLSFAPIRLSAIAAAAVSSNAIAAAAVAFASASFLSIHPWLCLHRRLHRHPPPPLPNHPGLSRRHHRPASFVHANTFPPPPSVRFFPAAHSAPPPRLRRLRLLPPSRSSPPVPPPIHPCPSCRRRLPPPLQPFCHNLPP